MKTFTLDGQQLTEGITVEYVILKDGARFPAVRLGKNEHNYGGELWLAIGRAPMKPCSEQGKEISPLHTTSWWASAPDKPSPEKLHTCQYCGSQFGPWYKQEWSNYPGEDRGPGTRGFRWTCVHPQTGQVPTRLMFATIGETLSHKPKLVGSAPDSDKAILVRINTDGGYHRDSFGRWSVVLGDPKTVASTAVQTSVSPRHGTFADGVVTMKPGDVLKVQLSGRQDPLALYFNADGKLTVALFEEWRAGQRAQSLTAPVAQEAAPTVEMLYGKMAVYQFGPSGWNLKPGIQTQAFAGGRGFKLGPHSDTRWRLDHTVTVMANDLPELVDQAALAKVNGTLVLLPSDKVEPGKFLVRIDTEHLRKRGHTAATPYKGQPQLLAEGWMEIGDKNPEHHRHQLWVVGNNDVLRVGQTGQVFDSDYAIYVEGRELKLANFHDWQRGDGKANPDFYLAENRAVPDNVPADWLGKPVMIVEELQGLDRERYFDERGPFTLTDVSGSDKVTVDLGWERPDPSRNTNVTHSKIWWVVLRPDVKLPEPEVLAAALGRNAEIERQLEAIDDSGLLTVAESALSTKLNSLKWQMVKGADWEKEALAALAEFEEVKAELASLKVRKDAGAILVNFESGRRRAGAAGICDAWIIRPDGTQRVCDVYTNVRHTDQMFWRLVEEGELALKWYGGETGEVSKKPVTGCTAEQLAAVDALEKELGLKPNAFGLNVTAQKGQDEMIKAMRKALAGSKVFRSWPELDYHLVVSNDGEFVDGKEGDFKRPLKSMARLYRETDPIIANRPGQLVEEFPVADGKLQVWLINKFGYWNAVVRWQKSS